MTSYAGGTRVKSGYYVDTSALGFAQVARDGDTLPGGSERSYTRVPVLLVMAAAPVLGGAFALTGIYLLVTGGGVFAADPRFAPLPVDQLLEKMAQQSRPFFVCVDCKVTGCPGDLLCANSKCVPDPCKGVEGVAGAPVQRLAAIGEGRDPRVQAFHVASIRPVPPASGRNHVAHGPPMGGYHRPMTVHGGAHYGARRHLRRRVARRNDRSQPATGDDRAGCGDTGRGRPTSGTAAQLPSTRVPWLSPASWSRRLAGTIVLPAAAGRLRRIPARASRPSPGAVRP